MKLVLILINWLVLSFQIVLGVLLLNPHLAYKYFCLLREV
jgi:hypothetical protein